METLDPNVQTALMWGLGGAFLLSLLVLVLFMFVSDIHQGLLGLIFLLDLIFFLIAFSIIIAAATPGWSVRLSIAIIDAVVAISTRLLSKTFLDWLG